MKETVKINLNQILFDLDSDAYHKLKNYLNTLKEIFKASDEESDEILADIEQRINGGAGDTTLYLTYEAGRDTSTPRQITLAQAQFLAPQTHSLTH